MGVILTNPLILVVPLMRVYAWEHNESAHPDKNYDSARGSENLLRWGRFGCVPVKDIDSVVKDFDLACAGCHSRWFAVYELRSSTTGVRY